MKLHVARALELLIDEIVHATAGIDEAGGNDGQASSTFGVSSSAKEALGGIKGHRVDASGEGATAGRQGQVIGTGEAGNAIEQDDHIHAILHQPLCPLQSEVRHLGMGLHRFIESRADHVPSHRALHIGDLLGALPDEADHDMYIIVVGSNAISDMLEHHCLARLGRGDDQPALSATDGSDKIEKASGEIILGGLQIDEPVGKDWCKGIEMGTVSRLFGVDAVHRLDAEQAVVFLSVLWRSHLPGYHVAGPESKATDLGLGDINVARP